MSALAEAKRAFYRGDRVAQEYEQQRFGGLSGAYVNRRELDLVAELLPPRIGTIADVGSGTGRLLPLLTSRAQRVLALDASMAMLGQARRCECHSEESTAVLDGRGAPATRNLGASSERGSREQPFVPATLTLALSRCGGRGSLIQADAFALPLRSGVLDAATCLRVLFHFDQPGALLRELRRVVKPSGVLVADTVTWSPRGLLPLGRSQWGERVAAVGRARFRELAQASGWVVEDERACFLISPYMYRRLRLGLARALERLERHLPEQLLCRVFWRLAAAA